MSSVETPTHTESPVLQLRGVSLAMGKREVLQHINLDMARGTVAVLYGANGAGKSTLLKLLAGLQGGAKFSGTGQVLQHPLWRRAPSERARIGYMPQQGGLYDELSVLENLRFRASMLGDARHSAGADAGHVAPKALAMHIAERYALLPILQQPAGRLSGGWKQRLAFAIALMGRPQLLLLDEPTAGVDLEAKAQIWQLIEEQQRLGTTILLSSHDPEEVRRAQLLVHLHQGRIAYCGAPNDLLLAQPLAAAVHAGPEMPATVAQCPVLFGDRLPGDKPIRWRLVWRVAQPTDSAAVTNAAGQKDWESVTPTLEDGLRALLHGTPSRPGTLEH